MAEEVAASTSDNVAALQLSPITDKTKLSDDSNIPDNVVAVQIPSDEMAFITVPGFNTENAIDLTHTHVEDDKDLSGRPDSKEKVLMGCGLYPGYSNNPDENLAEIRRQKAGIDLTLAQSSEGTVLMGCGMIKSESELLPPGLKQVIEGGSLADMKEAAIDLTRVQTSETVVIDEDSSHSSFSITSKEAVVDLTADLSESASENNDKYKAMAIDLDGVDSEKNEPPSKRHKIDLDGVDSISDTNEPPSKRHKIDLDGVDNASETNEPTSKRHKSSQLTDSAALRLEIESIESIEDEKCVEVFERDETQLDKAGEAASDSAVIDLSENTTNTGESEVISNDYNQMSVYQFTGTPRELTRAWNCYKKEDNSNYLKGCKWAPDGTCLMTNSEDGVIRLFNLPDQLYQEHGEDETYDELVPVLKMKEADTIYDYSWFPLMSSANPETACLAVTSKGTPVHLFDAFTGDLRCSYRSYDHLDEIVAAHCISFNPSGNKLYCGFNKMIRVFDVTRPGREFQNRPTFAKVGQRGIISCIAHSPSEHGLYAAGSYSRSIALYQDQGRGEMVCMFEGQQGGVTQLMFSPDGTRLYSGGRKDNEVICWDLRNPGHILFTMMRNVQTNQRMYFDITSDGKFLVSGSHEGTVIVWDTTKPPVCAGLEMDPILEPAMMFQAHPETVNGLSLHPSLPVIATASGQRHYARYHDDSEDEDTGDTEIADIDNSLRLWWMP